jgi:hypothetical protein
MKDYNKEKDSDDSGWYSNIVELQYYMKLEDMVHITRKVEKQIKKKGSSWL